MGRPVKLKLSRFYICRRCGAPIDVMDRRTCRSDVRCRGRAAAWRMWRRGWWPVRPQNCTTEDEGTDIPPVMTTAPAAFLSLRTLGFPRRLRRTRWTEGQLPGWECWTSEAGHMALRVCAVVKLLVTRQSIPEAARRLAQHPEVFAQVDAAMRIGADTDVILRLVQPLRSKHKATR